MSSPSFARKTEWTASEEASGPEGGSPAEAPITGAPTRRRRGWIAFSSSLLLLTVLATAGVLATWKADSLALADAAAASQPEPMEAVTVAVARPHEHRQTVTAIGTVLATRSVTLRNELPGTVRWRSAPPTSPRCAASGCGWSSSTRGLPQAAPQAAGGEHAGDDVRPTD